MMSTEAGVTSRHTDSGWIRTFNEEELCRIEHVLGSLDDSFLASCLSSTNPNTIANFAGWFRSEADRQIGYRFLEHADILDGEEVPVAQRHFYFGARGGYFYRWREVDDFALDEAIRSFRKQIFLAPAAASYFENDDDLDELPGHAGYRQLRIIEEKRGNVVQAIDLCKTAQGQGWADDWEKHIARLEKKQAKQR